MLVTKNIPESKHLVAKTKVARMLVVKTKQNASCKTKVVRMLVVKTAIAVVLVMVLVL